MIDLSVIIVSFNTKKITKKCIDFLYKNFARKKNITYEVIVIDNNSQDGSVELLKKYKKIKLILNHKNTGFGKPNNQGLRIAKGKYILYLNSDAIIKNINFKQLLSYLDARPKVGGLTVKVVLRNGNIDPASHRGFPTPWNSFCYYSKLEKTLGKVPFFGKYFGGYHLTCLDLSSIHEIDCPSAAFFIVKRKILKKIGGFDEDYFLYGEDIDMAYRIRKLGYKIIYYPLYKVFHMKSVSGLKKKNNLKTRNKTKDFFYNSMKIFYNKHYSKKYPLFIKKLIFLAIDFKKKHS